MSTSERRWRLILAGVLVWVVSAGVAELAFRGLGEKPTSELAGLYESFGDGNYKHRAWVRADANWVTGRFTVQTDGFGLRCSRTDADKRRQNASVDLLLLGDSQGYGMGLGFEESLAGRLAQRGRSRSLTVSNASVGGHYLDNQFELARWLYGRGLRSRNIIVLLTPAMLYSAGRLNRVRVGGDGRLYEGPPSLRQSATLWLKTHTVVYGMVRNTFRELLPRDTPQAVKLYERSLEDELRTRLASRLAEFRDWAREYQSGVLVVYTPLALEMEFGPVREAALARGVVVDRELPARVAGSASAACGIPFHDLRPALAGEKAASRPLSLFRDPHYNARTSDACAERLWQAVEGVAAAAENQWARKGHDGS
jgi:hypothetical protein